jgi:xanthine dehydrogenase iron-sulfur cluster and FAD-binding subunit A
MIAQYIIISIIVAIAAAFIVRKFILAFTKKGCASGSCGCAASEIEHLKQNS